MPDDDLWVTIKYDTRAGSTPGWFLNASSREGYQPLIQDYRLTASEVELFFEHGERAMASTEMKLTKAVKAVNQAAIAKRVALRRSLEAQIANAERKLAELDADDA